MGTRRVMESQEDKMSQDMKARIESYKIRLEDLRGSL